MSPVYDYAAEGFQYDTHTTQQASLGTRAQLIDGRVYHYAKNGAVALTVGKLCQTAVEVANNAEGLAVATTAAAAKSVTVTLGATAATADQFKDGYMVLQDGGGENGHYYSIATHPAADASATLAVQLKHGLATAITSGTEEAGLYKNMYQDIIVFPTTVTGAPVGVPNVDIAASSYGWIQTWGPCAILADLTTHAVGAPIEPSADAAGAVDLFDRSGTVDAPQIGITLGTLPVDTEYPLFYLMIAP